MNTKAEATTDSKKVTLGFKPIPLLLTLVVGLIIWLCPHPDAITTQAWHLLAIFVATIVGLIVKPVPMGVMAIVSMSIVSLTQTLTIKQTLTGFSNSTIWLIVSAFFLSQGFLKTGLGKRIAYFFISIFGKKTLGLAYGLSFTNFILSPAIPSNTARLGGVLYPLYDSIAKSYESYPNDPSSKRIGAFLMKCGFQTNTVISAMFLTAMAANPLAAQFAAAQGVDLTWGLWALANIVPGLICLAVIPFFLYTVYPPEIKESPQAAAMAKEELKNMGKFSGNEKIMLGVFVLLFVMWMFGGSFGIASTTTAFTGLSILLVTGVLTWDDILKTKGAWNTLTWFSALIMMASFLSKLGLIAWLSTSLGSVFAGMSWQYAFIGLALVYVYSHYMFASNTAHVAAMYAAFLAVAISVGTPPLLAAVVLGAFGNLMAGLTHYGAGTAPIYYGSGYCSMKSWWTLGLACSIINVVIWGVVGSVWWQIIGIY